MRAATLLFAAVLALAGPAHADPESDWAVVQQQTLPSLAGRVEAANAKIEARSAYFAGTARFESAFPLLVGAGLQQRAVLVSRLARLDDAEAARAAERVAPRPALDDAKRSQELDAALTTALDAEDRADALERRLLLGLRAALDAQPSLEAQALDRYHAALQAELDAAGDPASSADAARRIADIDEDRRRMQVLVADLRRVATVPGTAAPDPTDDIGRLAGPRSHTANARLERMLPFLPAPVRADTEAAMVAWYQTTRIPELEARVAAGYTPQADSVEGLREALAAADDELDAAIAALPDTVPTTNLIAAQHRVAGIERELAVGKRQAIAGAILLHEQDLAAQTHQQNSAQSAARAAAEALVAREQADQALDQRLSNRRLDAVDRAGRAWTETGAFTDALDQAEVDAQQRLVDFADKTATAELPILGADLPPEIANANDLYVELREYIDQLRSGVGTAYETHDKVVDGRNRAMLVLAAEKAEVAQAEGALSSKPAVRAEQIASLNAWREAIENEQAAWDGRLERASLARDESFRRLRQAKAIRRTLAGKATASVRAQDEFLVELQFELGMLGQNLTTLVSDRLAQLFAVNWFSLPVLWSIFTGSFRAFLLAGFWWYARRASPGWVHQGMVYVRRRWPEIRPVDLAAIKDEVLTALHALLDLVAGYLLLQPLWAGIPELGLVLYMYMHLATWRLLRALYELLVVPSTRIRPALRVVTEATYETARLSLDAVAIWYLSRRVVAYITLRTLETDAIHDLLMTLFWWAGFALWVFLMHRWEPVLREGVGRMHQSNRIIETLAKGPPSPWLQAPFSIGHAVLLGLRGGWNTLAVQAEQRERLGRLFNYVTRYQYDRDEEEALNRDIPPELTAAICAVDCHDDVYVPRQSADLALDEAVAAWQKEQRRGLVALIGDRGDGKRTWLDVKERQLQGQGLDVTRVTLDQRLTRHEDLNRWLADAFGVPYQEGPEEMAESLKGLPPGIYVIEGGHLAFLRAVQGFGAIRKLLYLLNAAGDRHLWVVAFHRPAWRYLERLGELVDVGVFRAVVELKPMGERELRDLCLKRAERAGVSIDFKRLVRTGALGGDPQIELERTINIYFRLLSEASAGNPAVALEMFALCMSPLEGDSYTIHFADFMDLGTIDQLNEADLFTLVALRTQDILDEAELVHVTNMSPGNIRSVVKLLQSRGLVVPDGHRLRISELELPAVTRTLRRRHFLQWAI